MQIFDFTAPQAMSEHEIHAELDEIHDKIEELCEVMIINSYVRGLAA